MAAIAAGSVALAVSHDSNEPSAPAQQSSVQQDAPHIHHFHYTTSGGRVMVGP